MTFRTVLRQSCAIFCKNLRINQENVSTPPPLSTAPTKIYCKETLHVYTPMFTIVHQPRMDRISALGPLYVYIKPLCSHHPLQKVFRTFSRIHLFPQYRQKLQKQSQVTRIQEKKGNCITIVQFQISSLLLIIPLFSSFDHACRKSQLYNVHLLYYSLFQSIGLFIFTFCKPTLHLLSYSIGICAAVPYFRAFLAA